MSSLHFVYLDESDDRELGYSAFTAVIFEDGAIAPYRDFLVQRFRTIFGRNQNEALPFEHLHASELPHQFSDEQKVAVFDAFAEAAAGYASGVYRVGYGWETSVVQSWCRQPQRLSPANASRVLSLSTISFSLMQVLPGRMCFVCELDRNNFDKLELLYNYTNLHHQDLQLRAISTVYGKHPPLLEKVIGNLYAPKRDMLTQAADFASYQLKICYSDNKSAFKTRITTSVQRYSHLILRNDIIFDN